MSSPSVPGVPLRLTVPAVALVLLAIWGSAVLAYLPSALRPGGMWEAAGIVLHALMCGGGLILAAAALRDGERLLAFTLLAASFPLLLPLTKWALIAGGFLALVLAVEAFTADATAGRGLDPFDARVLAAACASTLMWLLLLAGSRVFSRGHLGSPDAGQVALGGAALIWAAVVPALIALYQLIRAMLVYPDNRDRRALAPVVMVAFSLLRILL